MKTSVIHIVGVPGVGKTTLALDIVAGLKRRGKSALALMENDYGRVFERPTSFDIAHLRENGLRAPYAKHADRFDYLIAEHIDPPPDAAVVKGDLVITMRSVE